MKHLQDIHTDRFYRNFIDDLEADLIDKRIEAKTAEGEIIYYDFDDAEYESEDEGTCLSEFGEAFYHKDGKVYQLILDFPDGECTAVNLLSENEIKELLLEVVAQNFRGRKESIIEEKPWTEKYL